MSTLYVDNLQPNLGSQVEIPNLKPITGQVIQTTSQTVLNNFQLSITVTSFAIIDADLKVEITPRQANSKIRVVLRFDGYGGSSNYQAVQMFNKVNDGTFSSTGSGEPMWLGNGPWASQTYDRLCDPSYTLGDTITFQPHVRRYSTSSTTVFGWGTTVGSEVIMYAQEIAQ